MEVPTYMTLFFHHWSCLPQDHLGQILPECLPLKLRQLKELEKLARMELGKNPEDGSEPEDPPLVRLSLAEKIKKAQAGVRFYEEQLEAANRWGLGDLAFFEALLAEEKAKSEKLKARQARARKFQAKGSIDVEALKQANDLVEVAESYGLKFKKRGKEYWALCPFHQEKTASFSINREKQVWSCFGCQESGDLIAFIQKIEGCDFLEACEKLGGSLG